MWGLVFQLCARHTDNMAKVVHNIFTAMQMFEIKSTVVTHACKFECDIGLKVHEIVYIHSEIQKQYRFWSKMKKPLKQKQIPETLIVPISIEIYDL